MCAMPNEERLGALRKMADADPTNDLAHFGLGRSLVELGQAAEAEASLRRVIELNPGHSQAHRYLGEALLLLGRKDEAVDILRTGYELAESKGEFQPRDQIRDLLLGAGVEPPAPASRPGPPPAAVAAGDGRFVCRRCGNANPRIDEAPFPNDLGRQIHETICDPCWREWFAMSIKVINEYRLNLMIPAAAETYDQHMKEFLGLDR